MSQYGVNVQCYWESVPACCKLFKPYTFKTFMYIPLYIYIRGVSYEVIVKPTDGDYIKTSVCSRQVFVLSLSG